MTEYESRDGLSREEKDITNLVMFVVVNPIFFKMPLRVKNGDML